MALRCKECNEKLIFQGGLVKGSTDLEIHKCYKCEQYYSYDLNKGKLNYYNIKEDQK